MLTTIGNMDLNYTLQEKNFTFTCEDGSNDICFDCKYNLEIIVSDGECNAFNGGAPYRSPAIPFAINDLTCDGTSTPIEVNIPFTNLPIGEYSITKRLSLQEEGIELAADYWMANSDCIKTVETIIQEFKDELDFAACNLDCDQTPEAILGDRRS